MTEANIIEISGVTKRFGSFVAVQDLSLDLRQGEFFSLLGPSGCGKTTALRMIAGFQDPSEGSISIDGQDMDGIPANKRPTNMVFQSYALWPHMTVSQNVAFGLEERKIARPEINDRVSDALALVGLSDFASRRPSQLSGGQQQRLCIARAIAVRPEVILMDEPCSALDPIATARIEELIDELRQSYTIIMVTHSMQQAARVSQRTAFFHLGKIIEVGDTDQIFTNPRETRTQDYITGRFG